MFSDAWQERGIYESTAAQLEGADNNTLERLTPTLQMINDVYNSVLVSMHQYVVPPGLDTTQLPEAVFRYYEHAQGETSSWMTENLLRDFAYNPYFPPFSEADKLTWWYRDLKSAKDQYEHIRKVCAATVAFKRYLIENDLSEEIIAYQTGTGWPLPEHMEGRLEKHDFIHYGSDFLSEYLPRGSAKEKDAGMHVYRITDDKGNQKTLLVLKGRAHGYTETNWEGAPYDLAFMPRFLKGIGTEFILSTFASGVDPQVLRKGTVKKGDLGVIVGAGDWSTLRSFMGPTTGDHSFDGAIFGGSFQNIAKMMPDPRDVRLLNNVIASLQGDDLGNLEKPRVFPTIENDTPRTPDFQDIFSHAQVQGTYHDIKKLRNLPKNIMDQFRRSGLLAYFRSPTLALAHGMVQLIERDGYFQSSPFGLPTLFNRQLRELPLLYYTDKVKPGFGGDSDMISDELVREEAAKAEHLMARVVSNILLSYLNLNTDRQYDM